MSDRRVTPGDIDRHFWLTRSVARMIGVNLTEAMEEGRLTPDGYCEMVSRCRTSGCCERCQSWLARQNGHAAAAPDCCANAPTLNALR